MKRKLLHRTWILPTAVLIPAALAAQAPTTSLMLRITADSSGQPLANVAVSVDSARTALTDVHGRVYIGDIPAGMHRVRVEALGYHTERLSIRFSASTPVTGDIALLGAAIEMEPFYVVVKGTSFLEREGFYKREKKGLGSFFDEVQVRQMAQRGGRLSDALRGIRGIRVVPSRSGYTLLATRGGGIGIGSDGGQCRPKVFLDGLEMNSDDIDLIAPLDWITGIEVYAGPSETPARYLMLAPCGVVLLWTHR
jgi:hypothetical protein